MTILDPKKLQKQIKKQMTEAAVLLPIEFIENGTEIKGQVFIRKVKFDASAEIDKAFTYKPDPADDEQMILDSIDSIRLRAAQVWATVCVDADGTPFFESVEQVLKSYPNMIKAMWSVSNSVNLWWGKSQMKSSQKMNSGQNSSSVESVDEVSEKQNSDSTSVSSDSGSSTEHEEEA